jgi:hypothetical protein
MNTDVLVVLYIDCCTFVQLHFSKPCCLCSTNYTGSSRIKFDATKSCFKCTVVDPVFLYIDIHFCIRTRGYKGKVRPKRFCAGEEVICYSGKRCAVVSPQPGPALLEEDKQSTDPGSGCLCLKYISFVEPITPALSKQNCITSWLVPSQIMGVDNVNVYSHQGC